MNLHGFEIDDAITVLRSWDSISATDTAVDAAFFVALEALAASSTLSPAWPSDLVARPCRLPPARWHAQCLRELLQATDCNPLRRAYHARWLLYALSGWDPVEAPLISVIIPVYNRAGMAIEAVESALRQTHLRFEIIVVDDGSSDHLDQLVTPYVENGRVTYAKKSNGGVSTARNMGVRLAKGHYLHFLDSDNLLNPDSLSRWLAAFTAIPDAELCYAPSEILTGPGVTPKPGSNQAPTGEPDCPTQNLMFCVVRKYPFLVGGVMLPRWVAAEAGPFDETLRRNEDTLYWFKLALRGTKVAGLRIPNNRRRINKENLSEASLADQLPDLKQARLITLTDLFHHPAQWVYAGHLIGRCLWPDNAFHWQGYGHPLWFDALARFLESIRHLKENGDKHGLSSRPLLTLFASQFFKARPNACHENADSPAARAVAEAIGQAWEESSPIDSQDVEVWFFPENGLVYPVDFPALSLIYQEIGERKDSPRPVLQGHQLARLLERAEAINGAVQSMKKSRVTGNS
jgi:glycosyltransferase involved in cell wall biosynthesis